MITVEKLLSFGQNDLPEATKMLSGEDLLQLVEWLSEKDDKIRYQSLLLLQQRSLRSADVYPFWDTFREKLKSQNSYQRTIGFLLIAENAKWDKKNRLEEMIDEYLDLVNDEKPITVRQCIQALLKILPYKKHLSSKIANKIMSIDLLVLKETMRKLILLDILSVLAAIRKYETSDEIEKYISDALTGGILDKKALKQVESML